MFEEARSGEQEVPAHAHSLTIPAIMRCNYISCVVPNERKAEAVRNTLSGEISTACCAMILRTHPNIILYLDERAVTKL
jgi:glucosamine-6-phosphate deaminase